MICAAPLTAFTDFRVFSIKAITTFKIKLEYLLVLNLREELKTNRKSLKYPGYVLKRNDVTGYPGNVLERTSCELKIKI